VNHPSSFSRPEKVDRGIIAGAQAVLHFFWQHPSTLKVLLHLYPKSGIMGTQPFIEKASGELVAFDPEKLRNSLLKSGTLPPLADEILSEIQNHISAGMSTSEIYRQAFNMLRQRKSATAARYSLKKAIMELGPTGYPFEQFIGQVLAHQGFSTQVGVVLQGRCVTHEMDVVATYNNTQYLVECKFYNSPGKYASVQVPLYVRARVDDIISFRERLPEYKETRFFGWVVTNTRFTDDALLYGRCAGLHMLSWDLPREKSLKEMIETTHIFPVTVLTGLSTQQKKYLLSKDIVLCTQLFQHQQVLDEIGFKGQKKVKIIEELEALVMNHLPV
jgi:hypothetical protein